MKGIRNITGVSCHIACALQLLAHGIPTLAGLCSDVLLLLVSSSLTSSTTEIGNDDAVINELCRMISLLVESKETIQPLDPSLLYQYLGKHAKLDAQDVGDVSTALYQLLNVWKDMSPEWREAIDALCGNGRTQQLIFGHCNSVLRINSGKIKSMACPFPFPLQGGQETKRRKSGCGITSNFQSAMDTFLQPTFSSGILLKDYDWEGKPVDSYSEKEIKEEDQDSPLIQNVHNDDDDDDDDKPSSWITTKSMKILQLPQHFFLSFDRFVYTSNGERVLNNKEACVDVSSSFQAFGFDYMLVGGVVHVSEGSFEEEGHYVVLICQDKKWNMIDDDLVRTIDDEQAYNYLNGFRDENGVHFCSVLVLYRHEKTTEECLALCQKVLDSYESRTTKINWSDPKALVGRKVKVKWAKGKFYRGIVDQYDESSGKHRVSYDDGDIREYVLSKKTLEWI